MTRRWVCPTCGDGLHAPSRPRRDDVRRFCLPCSAKSGRLVERTCPARETASRIARERAIAAKVRAAEAREVRAAADRELRLAQGEAPAALRALPVGDLYRATNRQALEVAAKRYARLAAWERDLSYVSVELRFGSKPHTTGRAWPTRHRIVVTVGTDAADSPHAVLLHEFAHIAAGPGVGRATTGPGRQSWHGARWRSFFLLAASEVAGERITAPGGINKYAFHSAVRDKLAAHIFKGNPS